MRVETRKGLLVDFILKEQFWGVEEIAQEPAQLPDSTCTAEQPPGDQATGQLLRFEHGKAQGIEGILPVSAVLSAVNTDQVDALRKVAFAIRRHLAESLDVAFHSAPSCL